jgi:hypothetical protein
VTAQPRPEGTAFNEAYASEQLRRSRHPLRRFFKSFYRTLRNIRRRTIVVVLSRSRREANLWLAGVSKYPLRKMTSFAIEGFTSFGVVPLRPASA